MGIPEEQNRIETIGEQLRAKIASKFTASTFLAGFALAVLTGQVFALWQSVELPLSFPVAVGAVFGSLFLFVDAIVRLDELTMPKRFWPESVEANSSLPRGGYLTDNDLWELQKRMIFFWQRLTIAATVITAIAVLVMLLPLSMVPSTTLRGWTFGCAVGGVVAAAVYHRWLNAKVETTFSKLVRPQD